MSEWYIYKGKQTQKALNKEDLPPSPPWRIFDGKVLDEWDAQMDERTFRRGKTFEPGPGEIEMVNTALYLRRPLLVTGKPGTGKSSLACSVAWELGLGSVLYWPVTTCTNLQDGLYQYDAVGRLQALQIAERQMRLTGQSDTVDPSESAPNIGRYLRLGPLGTALLPSYKPRVLLIDEIDKSDIDLPNDLLNVFEEGEFEIPELSRLADTEPAINVLPHDREKMVTIEKGRVKCREFPFVVMTSNGERELPAPFLRRCLRLDIPEPGEDKLARIVKSHFGDAGEKELEKRNDLIQKFLSRRSEGELATDQLLNAVFLTAQGISLESGTGDDKERLAKAVFRHLDCKEMD